MSLSETVSAQEYEKALGLRLRDVTLRFLACRGCGGRPGQEACQQGHATYVMSHHGRSVPGQWNPERHRLNDRRGQFVQISINGSHWTNVCPSDGPYSMNALFDETAGPSRLFEGLVDHFAAIPDARLETICEEWDVEDADPESLARCWCRRPDDVLSSFQSVSNRGRTALLDLVYDHDMEVDISWLGQGVRRELADLGILIHGGVHLPGEDTGLARRRHGRPGVRRHLLLAGGLWLRCRG